jgi:IMP dehydrogenase
MGSLGAMQQAAPTAISRSSKGEGAAEKLVPEGIEGRVPYKGSLVNVVQQLDGGPARGMGYCGCATIDELRTRREFVEITSAASANRTSRRADREGSPQFTGMSDHRSAGRPQYP